MDKGTLLSFFYIKFYSAFKDFKGTVRVISINPPCKDGNVRFTTVPLKSYLIIEEFNSDNFSIASFTSKKCTRHFWREPANENKKLGETKSLIFNSYLPDNAFIG